MVKGLNADYEIKEVKQIIPADGWTATFLDGPSGELRIQKLACWALIQEDKRCSRVVGVNRVDGNGTKWKSDENIGEMEFSEDDINFFSYAHGSQDLVRVSHCAKELMKKSSHKGV